MECNSPGIPGPTLWFRETKAEVALIFLKFPDTEVGYLWGFGLRWWGAWFGHYNLDYVDAKFLDKLILAAIITLTAAKSLQL